MRAVATIIILGLLINIKGYSQCNVKKEYYPEDKVTSFSFEPEKLYLDTESEEGIIGYDFNFIMFDFGTGEQLRMIIYSTIVNRDNPVLPRRISFFSIEGDKISMDAADFQTMQKDILSGSAGYRFYFDLGVPEMTYLCTKKISKVIVYDERVKKSITIKPFEKLFSNQLKCIMDDWYNEAYLKRKKN